ncbi:MAG TPA: hypothetical protein VH088_20380 [Terriglobales bacterium]|jgi:hypothetical protein|nr:hypothetical protein [Terriglobales bacterium]
MKTQEAVLAVYKTAVCEEVGGGYQILKLSERADFSCLLSLSALSETEAEAWEDALARIVRIQASVDASENNKRIVLRAFPDAYLSEASKFQIRKPRRSTDRPAHVQYVTLSGRFSVPELAWKDAAERITTVPDARLPGLERPSGGMALSDSQQTAARFGISL